MNTDRESGCVFCADGSRACESVSAAVASWSVWNGGRLVASGKGKRAAPSAWWYRWAGPFRAGPGHYVLNMDVLEDQSGLNLYEPHLVIYEAGRRYLSSQDQGFYAFLMSLLCVPLGAWMIILAARQEKRAGQFRSFPLTQAGPAPERFLPVGGPVHRNVSSDEICDPKAAPERVHRRHSSVILLTYLLAWIPWVVITFPGPLDPVRPAGPSDQAGNHSSLEPGDSAVKG